MAIAKVNIVEAGDPVLRNRAEEVPERLWESQELKEFIPMMEVAMKDAPGVGLAAPQLGVPLRIIVFKDADQSPGYLTAAERVERGRTAIGPEAWINPSYRALSEVKIAFLEGCLSVPGYQAMARRRAAALRSSQSP
jgi:peptide deformylase